MERQSIKYEDLFMGFVIGGFLGGLAGLVFAPKSGKELRTDIQAAGETALKEAKEVYEKASHRASEVPRRAKHIFSCFRERPEGTSKYSESADEFLGEA